MVEQCCVDGCFSLKTDITYFKLPVSRTLRKKWLDAIKSTCKLTDDAVVCSRHFLENHYMTVRGKRRLKPKVVPCVFENVKDKSDSDVSNNIDKDTINETTNEGKDNTDTKDKTGERIDNTDTKDKTGKRIDNTDTKDKTIKSKDKGSDRESSEEIVEKTVEGDIDRDRENSRDEKGDGSSKDYLSNSNESRKSPDECVKSTKQREFSPNKDIEEILTNYQIKQTRPLAQISQERETAVEKPDEYTIDLEREEETKYVEIPIQEKGQERDEDCLMLLENVEVDVDPGLFEMEPEPDLSFEQVDLDLESNSDVIDLGERKQHLISLLSSSDEDDVIIQEPKIDTIEVSDATDEDDIPLLKLAKRRKKMKKKSQENQKHKAITKIISYYKYECYHCKFTTNNTDDYDYHMNTHSSVLHCCENCSYTTSSKVLLVRHKDKHTKERRNKEKRFKCPLCNYSAKHNMSLVYHMSTHKAKSAFECEKCGFFSNAEDRVLKHTHSSTCGKFKCPHCPFSAKWKGALKKHLMRVHDDDEEEDDDYIP